MLDIIKRAGLFSPITNGLLDSITTKPFGARMSMSNVVLRQSIMGCGNISSLALKKIEEEQKKTFQSITREIERTHQSTMHQITSQALFRKALEFLD